MPDLTSADLSDCFCAMLPLYPLHSWIGFPSVLCAHQALSTRRLSSHLALSLEPSLPHLPLHRGFHREDVHDYLVQVGLSSLTSLTASSTFSAFIPICKCMRMCLFYQYNDHLLYCPGALGEWVASLHSLLSPTLGFR